MAGFVLQFGKYKGHSIEEVLDSYLAWMAENFEDAILSEVIEAEANRRGYADKYDLIEVNTSYKSYGYMRGDYW